jgi:hypothetical protein
MTVRLTVRGKPVPLQRHRTSRGRTYLPARSKAYRELVQTEWMTCGHPTLGAEPFTMSFADDSQLACLSCCHKLPVDAEGPRCVIELSPAVLDRDAVIAQLRREPDDDQPEWRPAA